MNETLALKLITVLAALMTACSPPAEPTTELIPWVCDCRGPDQLGEVGLKRDAWPAFVCRATEAGAMTDWCMGFDPCECDFCRPLEPELEVSLGTTVGDVCSDLSALEE